MSPTQRTLAKLRADGWEATVTEHWNAYAHIRRDLFGFCDVLAMAPGRGFLAVQCTTGDHVADRLNKIRDMEMVKTWLLSGGRLEVWGWRKTGDRGKRKTWSVRRVVLQVDGRRGVVCDAELG